MKTARLTVEVWSLACPACAEGAPALPEFDGFNEGYFADDRTGSMSLTSDSTVQGKRLNPGDVLKCERCGTRLRVPRY